jgi:protein-tyrosine phosphatase
MQVLKEANLVMGMAREHVRHAVVAAPETWPRAFTLKEFVRRAEEIGQPVPGEPFERWLERIHDDRDRIALLGDSLADDVADPMGGPMRRYAATAAQLDDLAGHFVELCVGSSAVVDLDPLCQDD